MRILLHPRRGIGDAHFCEHLACARARGLLRVAAGSCARMTSISCMPIVKTGFSEVIGSWKIMLMSLPRTLRISSHEQLQQIAPAEQDLAADDPARRVGNEPQDAERGDALAGARLADEAEHLARQDVEIDAVHRLGDAGLGVEVGPQAADLRGSGFAGPSSQPASIPSGSNASRTASPMKTTSSSVRNSAPSGKNTSHHFVRFSMPWPISSPQLGVGAGRPKPRKSSATSDADVRDDRERRERDDRRQRIGQDVAEHDRRLGDAGGDGRADVVLGLLAIELAADVVGDAHPLERRQDAIEQPERRLQHLHPARDVDGHHDRADDDDGVEEGQRRPDLDEALAEQVQLAAEVAERRADARHR